MSPFNGLEADGIIDQIFTCLDFSVELSNSSSLFSLAFLFSFCAFLLALIILSLFDQPVLLALLPFDEVDILLLLNMLVQVLVVFVPEGVFVVSQLCDFVVNRLLAFCLSVVKGLLFLVYVLSELLVLFLSLKPIFFQFVNKLILLIQLLAQRVVYLVEYLLFSIKSVNLLLLLLSLLFQPC